MRSLLLMLTLLSTLLLGGCELVGDIFQAGVAVGIILVVVVIAVVVFIGKKLMG